MYILQIIHVCRDRNRQREGETILGSENRKYFAFKRVGL